LGSGAKTIELQDWSAIYESYLAPWLVLESGEVKAASGDSALQEFIDAELRVKGQFDTYPNLVESLARSPALLGRLEDLSESTVSITGLKLASLRSFAVDPQVQQFFDETINTHSSLFEVNV
jgi:hypothetical protein